MKILTIADLVLRGKPTASDLAFKRNRQGLFIEFGVKSDHALQTDLQTCLFFDFADSGLIDRFSKFNDATGKRPKLIAISLLHQQNGVFNSKED